ncbi:MAG: CorA family divalent cation transporter [Verrucomicrobiota bacterium]
MPTVILKVPAHFNLEPELREQLGGRPGYQRCIEGHDELLLIVHEVPQGVVPGEALVFWRRHDGRWCQPSGAGIDELDALLGRYEDVIRGHFEVVNRADDAEEIFTTQRHAMPLLRAIRDLIKALEQVLSFDPNDRSVRGLRDRAREIELAADLLQADARVTLEFLRTRQGDELLRTTGRLGRIVDRLTLLVLVFLPLAALGAFLAMSGNVPVVVKLLLWGVFGAGLLATVSLLVPQVAKAGGAWLRKTKTGQND